MFATANLRLSSLPRVFFYGVGRFRPPATDLFSANDQLQNRSCSRDDLPICPGPRGGHIDYVTQKKIALDTISELPDDVSLDAIAERIEFLAAIQKGMDQLDRGEGIPHEEVKRQLATWLAS